MVKKSSVACGKYKYIVIGVSAGGLAALTLLLPALGTEFPAAVIVVQHVQADADLFLIQHLGGLCRLPVREAEDKVIIKGGNIYIAPPGYHLLVEEGDTFALSVDPPVHYSRPSIDVLFESAARIWGKSLIGIILTGASSDGARGLARIKEMGGLAIVQNPLEAEYGAMPRAAIATANVDAVLTLRGIGEFLNELFPAG